jgi:3-oxoadipyl-CoA thiolase
MQTPAYICDAVRTPFGRRGGALASVRTDDLAALPLLALMERNRNLDWEQVSDVLYGCANQAGEDNRNVARMAALLAGLPVGVPAVTINRLCGSGLDAVGSAARSIKSGEAQIVVAGGVESMSRAPYVVSKADAAFAGNQQMVDTTIGWRFVNKLMQAQYGTDSMPETAENLARECGIDREAQDRFALRSHERALAARERGFFEGEITPVTVTPHRGEPVIVTEDEHPRRTSLEALCKLAPVTGPQGTVTAGNASGINDGACAVLLACEKSITRFGLQPRARILGMAVAGVPPRIMGMGAGAAARKVLVQTGLTLADMDVIELNEAFAAQAIAVLRDWGLQDDDRRVNPNGGAIALGHPLGASGARLATTAVNQLHDIKGRYALCAMCIGVGQGIALVIERV